jgi:hypothetical protein
MSHNGTRARDQDRRDPGSEARQERPRNSRLADALCISVG